MDWSKVVRKIVNFGDGGVADNIKNLYKLMPISYAPIGENLQSGKRYMWYCLKNSEEADLVEQCLGNNSKTREMYVFQKNRFDYPVWVCLSENEYAVEFVSTLQEFKEKYDDFCMQIAARMPISRKLAIEEKIKIIIVDDMPEIRTMIMDKINCDEYEFMKEKDSPHNLASDMKKLHPHLVLMDVYMGDYNGTDEMKKLKMEFSDVCFIIMSSSQGERVPALIAGANAFIYKEIEGVEMKEIIDGQINKMFR